MDERLVQLKNQNQITKKDLMDILVKIAKNISVFDEMKFSIKLKKDVNEVSGKFKKEFLEAYTENFMNRISEIRNQEISYNKDSIIDKEKYSKVIDLIKYQEKTYNLEEDEKVKEIFSLISLYPTFIIEEPIHPVDSPFPGHQKVEYKNGTYYCPVKKNNENNPQALCRFCIAKQSIIS